ncbi:IS66-like element accessory protein TnpA [Loktanella sp. DJP18]|uniref:IS66-like element accessory protein TnpA n=1 Tax=Loktanella sp. DJP18 TaxID=3409788 RepID=UPI003BB6A0BF
MAGKKGQKRRFWSDEEKLLICTQARVPGVSVAQVARRYAMNTNLIHTWLRDPQFAPEVEVTEVAGPEAATFFPIEITGGATVPMAEPSSPAPGHPFAAQRIDITLSDGRRILVEGPTALSAIVAMVAGLTQ